MEDRKLLLIFCFCFAGADVEGNGGCYGSSVQYQNQSGDYHAAFHKGNVCRFWNFTIYQNPVHQVTWPWFLVFSLAIQVDVVYVFEKKITNKGSYLLWFSWIVVLLCVKPTSRHALIICLGYTLKVRAIMSSNAVKRCQGRCVDSDLKMIIVVIACVKNENNRIHVFNIMKLLSNGQYCLLPRLWGAISRRCEKIVDLVI